VVNTWGLILIETFFIYLKEKLAKGFWCCTVLYVATFIDSLKTTSPQEILAVRHSGKSASDSFA
jgi:hypothetical protein